MALALVAAVPVAAQRAPEPEDPWRNGFIAYPTYDGLEGFSGAFVLAWRKAARPGPIPTTAAYEITGRVSSSGTRAAQVAFDAPGLWRGWRLLVLAGADRLQRAPYYGLGNDPAADTVDSRRYFRYSLLRSTVFAALQREVLPHVRVHLGAQVRHYRSRPLDGDTTHLLRDLIAGVVQDTGSVTGTEMRTGLLYDSRDEEASPSRGVLLEALAAHGFAGLGDLGYTRYAFGARAFLPLGESTVLGLRQSVELADRSLPFMVMYERLTNWRPEDGFGGATTLRAHVPGRFLAPNRAVASVDLRYKKIDVPLATSPFRIWFVGFADTGRLWLTGEDPTLGGLQWDAGGAAFVQFSKGTLFGLNVGVSGADGFQFGSAFTFGF